MNLRSHSMFCFLFKNSKTFCLPFFLSCHITRSHTMNKWPHGLIHMDHCRPQRPHITHMSVHTTWYENKSDITLHNMRQDMSQTSVKRETLLALLDQTEKRKQKEDVHVLFMRSFKNNVSTAQVNRSFWLRTNHVRDSSHTHTHTHTLQCDAVDKMSLITSALWTL